MVEERAGKNIKEIDRCNVNVAGKIEEKPVECVSTENYKMYCFDLIVGRFSGKEDRVSVMVRKEIADRMEEFIGSTITVDGTLRTYKREDGRSRTWLLAHNFLHKESDINSAEIVGKLVSVRETVNDVGVSVCEMRIEVVSRFSKMSRITVVVWGDNVAELLNVAIGSRVMAVGRVQERGYKGSGKETNRNLEIASKNIEVLK